MRFASGSFSAVTSVLVMSAIGCGSARSSHGGTESTGAAGVASRGGAAASGPNIDLHLDGGTSGSGGAAAGTASIAANGCDDSCSAVGTCDDGTCNVRDNAGGLSADQQAALRQGGADGGPRTFLYPYPDTVFPRGMLPPTLQLDGGGADAAYVHISFQGFDYQGFFGPSEPLRITLPGPLWTTLTSTASGKDPVKVEVSCLRDGKVTGPAVETWTIAPGSLRGAIYYELTTSRKRQAPAIMQLKPGAAAPEVFVPGASCGSVSADGSRLLASMTDGLVSVDLRNPSQPVRIMTDSFPGCSSLYVDGSLAMLFRSTAPSGLIDSKTGMNVADHGWSDTGGGLAQGGDFSLDGSKLVFAPNPQTLAMLDFSANDRTFRNRTELAKNGESSVISPAFTPDGRAVIYFGTTDGDPRLDLTHIDVATKQTTRLAAASGGGRGYVNTNPSMLPVLVGGYAWLAFTSERPYGNLKAEEQLGHFWVAALDLDAKGGDPSHPAFYLDGQDSDGLNRYAHWALEPCQADGHDCESGDQCCGGYCREAAGKRQCLSQPPAGASCAAEFEKCAKPSDCCDADSRCVNSRCARPAVK